jgi:hypothetical protein
MAKDKKAAVAPKNVGVDGSSAGPVDPRPTAETEPAAPEVAGVKVKPVTFEVNKANKANKLTPDDIRFNAAEAVFERCGADPARASFTFSAASVVAHTGTGSLEALEKDSKRRQLEKHGRVRW